MIGIASRRRVVARLFSKPGEFGVSGYMMISEIRSCWLHGSYQWVPERRTGHPYQPKDSGEYIWVAWRSLWSPLLRMSSVTLRLKDVRS